MITFRNLTSSALGQGLKTALAATASVYIAGLLKLPEGYWAAISAIVVMQSEVTDTLAASRDRLAGTAIGAVIGALFVAYVGDSVPWFGAAVILTVLICELTGFEQSHRLACVTVAIVMLIHFGGSPWAAALHRFLEVALGILIALAVTAIPIPRRPLRNPGANV